MSVICYMLDSSKITILRQLFSTLFPSQKSDFLSWAAALDDSTGHDTAKRDRFLTAEDFLAENKAISILFNRKQGQHGY